MAFSHAQMICLSQLILEIHHVPCQTILKYFFLIKERVMNNHTLVSMHVLDARSGKRDNTGEYLL